MFKRPILSDNPGHWTNVQLRQRAKFNFFLRFLLWVGFCQVNNPWKYCLETGEWQDQPPVIRWPFHWGPKHIWYYHWCQMKRGKEIAGVFRNSPGVITWMPGVLLPRRWGFYFMGFEFGQRG